MSIVPGDTAELLQRGGVLSSQGEERLRRLLETTRAVPWEADARTAQFSYVGPQAVDLLGYPVEDWYDEDFWPNHIHPEDRDDAVQLCVEGSKNCEEYEFEYRMLAADGRVVWVHDIVTVVRADGEPRSLLGFLIDITERKLAEETMKRNEERLRLLVDALPVMISYVDRTLTYVFENKAYESWFGCRVTGKHVSEVQTETYESAKSHLEQVLAGGTAHYQSSIPGRDGKSSDVNVSMVPDHGVDGTVKGAFVVVSDVSELVQRHQALSDALTETARLKKQLEAENIYLQQEIKLDHNFQAIIGRSQKLRECLSKIEAVADTDTTVLITGETGTGKELMARALHDLSERKKRPFIKVDCAGLPPTLIESELFGREKGAFTGADRRQLGRFELAHGGTIFLDEMGELPLEVQAKLLRVLQDGEFERLGSPETRTADVRVIAATNRDLTGAVQAGSFRADLYYRLNVYPIRVPALRERREDIPLLANAFVAKFAQRMGKGIETIPQAVMDALQSYSWPGNIRELQNLLERSVIVSSGSALRLGDKLSGPVSDKTSRAALRTLEDVEREHISRVLEETGWKIEGAGGAATVLGLNPGTLRARLRKLGIRRPR
jgi:PAS domain S-box-containing protein